MDAKLGNDISPLEILSPPEVMTDAEQRKNKINRVLFTCVAIACFGMTIHLSCAFYPSLLFTNTNNVHDNSNKNNAKSNMNNTINIINNDKNNNNIKNNNTNND